MAIASKLKKLKYDKVIPKNCKPRIVCSPYWRCLKTAAKITDGLGKSGLKIAENTMYPQKFPYINKKIVTLKMA